MSHPILKQEDAIKNHKNVSKRRKFLGQVAGVTLCAPAFTIPMLQRMFGDSMHVAGNHTSGDRECTIPPTPLATSSIPLPNKDLRLSETSDNHNILSIHSSTYNINRTGAEILKLCDGKRTVGDITRLMSSRYEQSPSTAQSHCLEYLNTLHHVSVITC